MQHKRRRVGKELVIGLMAGLVSGLLGVGGAFVTVPALVRWRNLPQRHAQATSLGTTAVAATIAASTYLVSGFAERGRIEGSAVLILALVAPLAAMISARLLPKVSERTASLMFGLAMLALVPAVLFAAPQSLVLDPPIRYVVLIVVGILAGMLSGFLGIGSGLVLVPLLVLFVTTSQRVAQGMSLLAIAPTALAGSVVHWRTGLLRLDVVVWVASGAAVGAVGGGWSAQIADETLLRWLLVGALVVVGFQQIAQIRRNRVPALEVGVQ